MLPPLFRGRAKRREPARGFRYEHCCLRALVCERPSGLAAGALARRRVRAADFSRNRRRTYAGFALSKIRIERCASVCRDVMDQMFLDLAQSGGADALVSGDHDLLALAGRTQFLIETTEAYRRLVD